MQLPPHTLILNERWLLNEAPYSSQFGVSQYIALQHLYCFISKLERLWNPQPRICSQLRTSDKLLTIITIMNNEGNKFYVHCGMPDLTSRNSNKQLFTEIHWLRSDRQDRNQDHVYTSCDSSVLQQESIMPHTVKSFKFTEVKLLYYQFAS